MMVRIGTKFYKVLLVECDVVLQEFDPELGGLGELSSVPLDQFHPLWIDKILEFGQKQEFEWACLDLGPDQPLMPFDWADDTEWED